MFERFREARRLDPLLGVQLASCVSEVGDTGAGRAVGGGGAGLVREERLLVVGRGDDDLFLRLAGERLLLKVGTRLLGIARKTQISPPMTLREAELARSATTNHFSTRNGTPAATAQAFPLQ